MLPEIWVASEKRPRYTKQKRKATRVAVLQRGTFGTCVTSSPPAWLTVEDLSVGLRTSGTPQLYSQQNRAVPLQSRHEASHPSCCRFASGLLHHCLCRRHCSPQETDRAGRQTSAGRSR